MCSLPRGARLHARSLSAAGISWQDVHLSTYMHTQLQKDVLLGDTGRYDFTQGRLHPGLSRHEFPRVNEIRGWGGVEGLWHRDDSFLYCQMRTSEQTLTQQLWCSHSGMLLRKNKKQTPATLHCTDASLKGMWEEAARCKRVNVSWSHPLHTQQTWGSYNYREQIRVCLEH